MKIGPSFCGYLNRNNVAITTSAMMAIEMINCVAGRIGFLPMAFGSGAFDVVSLAISASPVE